MTQEEIRKLLGGYATNSLTDRERTALFEAALEDQELFNALQNEDALRELLADPATREQVRLALEPADAHAGLLVEALVHECRKSRRYGRHRDWNCRLAQLACAGVIEPTKCTAAKSSAANDTAAR